MPWQPEIVSGVQVLPVLNSLARQGPVWPGAVDAGAHDLNNVNGISCVSLEISGKPVADLPFRDIDLVSTSNPAVFTFQSKRTDGVSVCVNGLRQSPSVYALIGVAPTIVVPNGNFETSGAGFSWSPAGAVSASGISPHSGSVCVKISSNGGYIYQTLFASVTPGKMYEVAFYAKSSLGCTAPLTAVLHDGSATVGSYVSLVPYVPGQSWEKVVLTYAGTADGNLGIGPGRGSGAGDIFIDDVTVRELNPDLTWNVTFNSSSIPASGSTVSVAGKIA